MYTQCLSTADALYSANSTQSSDDAGLDAYYGLACAPLQVRRKDSVGLVRKSLYYFQVLHYTRVYGESASFPRRV